MPEARKVNMTAAFSLRMNNTVLERQVTVGKFDGKTPALVCATTGGKIMFHNSKADVGADQVQFLNINRPTTALAAGPSASGNDVLYVGTQSSLLAYNVEKNSDLFFRDVTDGITTMCMGVSPTTDSQLLLVGGQCSILGFDDEGEERFWTVTSDSVSALTLLPWSQGGKNTLLVGSDDFVIRAFENEATLCQMNETARVAQLCPTKQAGRFIYGLDNGTVGVYERQQRAWRYKSKHKLVSMASCDVDFDGVAEVLCGWSNGKFEVRTDAGLRNGEATYKDTFATPVSAVLSVDYRMDGRENPLVCSYDGDVRGYIAVETSYTEAVETHEQDMLEKLMQQKQQALFDISNLEKQIGAHQSNAAQVMPNASETKLSCKLRPNAGGGAIDLVLSVSGGAVIQGATIAAEIVFGSAEAVFVAADEPSDTLVASFKLEKDVAAELKVTAMVGFAGVELFQVHDLTVKLPKFAMYVPVREFTADPEGCVTARINERINRMVMWAQHSFNGYQGDTKAATFEARFVSLRDGLQILVSATTANGGEVLVRANSMDVCGDIIQDLGAYLGVTELQTTAEFPQAYTEFQDVLQKVEEYNRVRMKLTAEMADSTQLVKALVIKAEDARILAEMKHMKKMYGSLYEVNRELIGEFMKRSNNHNELLAALKQVNAMIQVAGKLRIGQAKVTLVAECRNAIKANNVHSLFNIIRTGKPT
jgi:Bardet-Biedl syndrome 2 protein